MIEVFNVFVARAQSLTLPEVMALLTTLVALLVAMERMINAVSRAIRALIEFIRFVLYGDYESDEP